MRSFVSSRVLALPCLVALVSLSSALVHAGANGRLAGTVRDAETKKPLAGAAVRLYSVPDDPYYQGSRWETVTDSSGAFSFTIPADELPGRFFTVCYKPGFAPNPPDHLIGGLQQRRGDASTGRGTAAGNPLGVVPIRQGQVAQADIGLIKGGGIRGRLTCRYRDGIRPCALTVMLSLARPPRAPYTLGELHLTAEPDGSFAFEDLFPSTAYLLEFSPDGYVRSTIESVAVTPGNDSVIDRELDCTSQTGIEGTLLIEGATPENGSISVIPAPRTRPPDHSRFCSGRTRGDGSFSCFGLPPGTYRVMLSGSRADGIRGTYETTVTLGLDQTQTLHIDAPRRER